MSNREYAKDIIDRLPEYKINSLIIFLRGMEFDSEIEDEQFCHSLVDEYISDTSPDKHDNISIEEFAKLEGITI